MNKRQLDVLILSDIHLGTRGCEANCLIKYLKSVEPKLLVLNGDIIDIWQFKTGYFPSSHWAVISEFIDLASRGIPVYYLPGNHDDSLRKLVPFKFGNIQLEHKLLLELDGKHVWIFHGDIYDGSITHGRWAAKIAGRCYDSIIVFNRFINRIRKKIGLKPTHFSKKLKSSVKSAVQKVSNFETKAIETAIDKGYDFVACGHIHRPQIREVENDRGKVTYLNSGDWMENRTSLEYYDGKWLIYTYNDEDFVGLELEDNSKISLSDLINNTENNQIQEILKTYQHLKKVKR
jgi:UDP-2,3-diacylglucosamine pyrophosphatase LpxH